ncbi:MAG: nickel pincer cofactor biosynthesis protein LarB [Actinobacteria bacterium]|nr:nickel pincer cofactor biosynthesis protein LarB [Actinomycetota bacterium]
MNEINKFKSSAEPVKKEFLNGITSLIEKFLKDYRDCKITEKDFIAEIKNLYFEDIEYAKIDHHRALRRGFPEVVYGKNKTPPQILEISQKILKYSDILLVTRTDFSVYELLKKHIKGIVFDKAANLIYKPPKTPEEKLIEGITVLCAGTTDIPVAEEAAVTAYLMGNKVKKIYDVGVAGIHRLLSYRDCLLNSNIIIAVAGMEGALPGVVSSLVSCPVIGVPTSIGYGASFSGLSPLLTMLNSCSPGILVTNIDNGFGAGYSAGLINKKIVK